MWLHNFLFPVKISVNIGFLPFLAGGPGKIFAGVIRSKFPSTDLEELSRPTFVQNFMAVAQKLAEIQAPEGTITETHEGT